MKKSAILFFALAICSLSVSATIRTTAMSGDWNNTAVWGGTVPLANDEVVISSGHTVSINVNPNNITNVTVSGTLQWDATGTGRTWTVTGNFTINGSGSFICAAPGTATVHTFNYNGTSFTNNGNMNLVNGTNKCNMVIGNSVTQSIGGTSTINLNKLTLNNTGGKFVIDYGGGTFTPSETAPTKLNVSITTADSMVIKQGLLIGCATNNATITHNFASFKLGGSGAKITSSVNIFTSVTTLTVNSAMILNDATNANVSMNVNGAFISPSMSQSNAATAFGVLGPNCFGGAGNATSLSISGEWNMTDIFVFVGNTKVFGGTEPNNPVITLGGSMTWASSETHTIDVPFTAEDFLVRTCFFGLFDAQGAFPQMNLNGGSVATPNTLNVAFRVFDADVQSSSPLGDLTLAQISESMANWTVNGNWKVTNGSALAVHSDNTLTVNGSLRIENGGEVAGSETETEDIGYVPTGGPSVVMGSNGVIYVENSSGLGKGLLSESAAAVAFKNRTADLDWNMNGISNAGTVDYAAGGAQTVTDRTYYQLACSNSGIKTMANAITVNSTLSIGTGTTLANGGFDATAKGTVLNNGIHSGTGKLILGGTVNQSLSGTGSEWGNLLMNNAAGATCNSTVNTTGNVTLTSGILTTSSGAKLVFGTSGGFIGGSAVSCVYGPVSKTTASTAEFTFQVGKGLNYRPVSVTPVATTATTWTAEYFASGYVNTSSVLAPVTSVNTHSYWTVDRISGADGTVKLQWNTTEALADLNGLTVARWDGTQWTDAGVTATTGGISSGTVTSATVSSFSPFTLGEANTIATGVITGSPFCPGTAVSVPFTSTGTFGGSNVYTAQISDKMGSFDAAVAMGTLTSSANTGTINAVIPSKTAGGTKFRIRVISSSPAVTGSNNGSNLKVTSCDAPTGITVSPINSTNATINWTAVPCAYTYTIQYRVQGTSKWTKKKDLTGTSKKLTSLLANTVYEYKMQTVCTADNKSKSSFTDVQTFTTLLKLEAPSAPDLQAVQLYPNPGSNTVVISFESKNTGDAEIKIFNTVGQQLLSFPAIAVEGLNEVSIDIRSLPAGVYIVKLINGNESALQKLVKE